MMLLVAHVDAATGPLPGRMRSARLQAEYPARDERDVFHILTHGHRSHYRAVWVLPLVSGERLAHTIFAAKGEDHDLKLAMVQDLVSFSSGA